MKRSKKEIGRRLLSLFLAVTMLASLCMTGLPAASATETEEPAAVSTEAEEPTEVAAAEPTEDAEAPTEDAEEPTEDAEAPTEDGAEGEVPRDPADDAAELVEAESFETGEPTGDPTADVETEEDWAATLSRVELTGHYGADVLAVAKTQLGYEESGRNYVREGDRQYGYTRYGAWYGSPYGDWCAMFVSFCLAYANVPEEAMMRQAGCRQWTEALKEREQYAQAYETFSAEEKETAYGGAGYTVPTYDEEEHLTGYRRYYIPAAGDLVFFDYDGDGSADHVGLVSELDGDDDAAAELVTIEGNSSDAVRENRYSLTYEGICGYGILPVNMPAQELSGSAAWNSREAGRKGARTEEQIAVAVTAPEGALPAGSRVTLERTDVTPGAVSGAVYGQIRTLTGLELRFIDPLGAQVEPAKAVRVTLSGRTAEQMDNPIAVYAGEEPELLKTEPGSITFETEKSGVYALVEAEGKQIELPAAKNEPLLARRELSAATLRLLNRSLAQGVRGDGVPTEGPVTDGSTSIESVTISWCDLNDNRRTIEDETLALQPTTDRVESHSFVVSMMVKGETHEAGSIELVLPAYIWLDRDGAEAGKLTFSIPEEPNTEKDFMWRRDGDYVVITNTRKLTGTVPLRMTGTFREVQGHRMEDGVTSLGLSAQVNLTTATGTTLSLRTERTLNATIDTYISASQATKSALNAQDGSYYVYYGAVPENMPEEFLGRLGAGADATDYVYVRWYVTGVAVGNQPYTMTLRDTVESGGVMLGVQGANGENVASEDGESVSAVLLREDYRLRSEQSMGQETQSAFVWTAYPKSQWTNDEPRELKNTATIEVTGADDGESSSVAAEGTVQVKRPTTYIFHKDWDDNVDAKGHRPNSLYIWIYRDGKQWQRQQIWPNAAGNWEYSWSDEGKPYTYEVYEHASSGYVNSPNSGNKLSTYTNSVCSGVERTYYDAQGAEHIIEWWYALSEAERTKDAESGDVTIRFCNKYYESGNELAAFRKTVEKYTNSWFNSTGDRAVNSLLRGEDVDVTYRFSGAEAWVNGDAFHLELTDTEWLLNDQAMSLADVSVSRVELQVPYIYACESTGTDGEYRQTRVTDADKQLTVELQARIGGAWTTVATMSRDGVVTAVRPETSVNNREVTLPSGTEQIRLLTSSTDEDLVVLNCRVTLTVHPTRTVLQAVEDSRRGDVMMLTLKNKGELQSYDADGNLRRESQAEATGYLHGRMYRVASRMEKASSAAGENGTVEITTTARNVQQTNIGSATRDGRDRKAYDLAISEELIPYVTAGVWYDLLPPNVTPDLSSIELGRGDRLRDAYAIENYRGSGRTLVVISATFADHSSYVRQEDQDPGYVDDPTYPQEGWSNEQRVTFKSYYLPELGKLSSNYPNLIAFESDEGWIGNTPGWMGEPDDPTAGNNKESAAMLPERDWGLMTDLDAESNDPSFVYASAVVESSFDWSFTSGLSKKVSVAGSGVWTRGTAGTPEATVPGGGRYTYALVAGLSSSAGAKITNVVLLDKLERYAPTGEDPDAGDTNTWRGTLVSVDVTDLERQGIAPVVYYSTSETADVDGFRYEDLSDGSVWSATAPDDLSTVTAIAVDASRKADGSAYKVPDEDTVLAAYVIMRAPVEGFDASSHAYNKSVLSTKENGVSSDLLSQYTKVGVKAYRLPVVKEWADDGNRDGLRPESVKIHLYCNGADTGKFVVLSGENRWRDEFTGLAQYDEDGNYNRFSFVETDEQDAPLEGYRLLVTRAVGEDGESTVTLSNIHEPHLLTIPVEKQWRGEPTDEVRPGSVTVYLCKDGRRSGSTLTLSENNNWRGAFTNLYERERGADGAWHTVTYSVEEEPTADYLTACTQRGDGTWVIENTYYPYGDLSVTKEIETATEAVSDQAFTYRLHLYTVTDETSYDVLEKYAYTVEDGTGRTVSEGTAGNGDTFTLRGGQTLRMADLPTNIRYRVEEESLPGWRIVSSAYTEGEIKTGQPQAVSFTNAYTTAGSVQLQAAKEVADRDGAALDNHPLRRGQFRFYLEDEQGEKVCDGYNAADGSVSFPSLRYGNADDGRTYTYYIKERDLGQPGYTYDPTVYQARVTPVDNGDGTMTCDVTYYSVTDSGEQGEALQGAPGFQNRYRAEGTGTLDAVKILKGGKLSDYGPFHFELLDETGHVIERTVNSGTQVRFTRSYTEQDVGNTYYYFIREAAGSDTTVVYDTAALIGYRVTVADNGDGTLFVDSVPVEAAGHFLPCEACHGTGLADEDACTGCDGTGLTADPSWTAVEVAREELIEKMTIRNGLMPGSLSVAKYTQNAPEDDRTEFRFKVVLNGEDLAESYPYELEQVANEPPAASGGDGGQAIDGGDMPHSVAEPDRSLGERIGDALHTLGQWLLPTAEGEDTHVCAILTDDYDVDGDGTADAGTLLFYNGINTTTGPGSAVIDGHTCTGTVFAPLEGGSHPWTAAYKDTVKTVIFTEDVTVKSAANMFKGCSNLTAVEKLYNLHLDNGTDGVSAYQMFRDCSSLTAVETVNPNDSSEYFDTSNVTDMSRMFWGCRGLTTLDVSDWNTSNVTDMFRMFWSCSGLTALDVSNWNTSNVTDMGYMFYGCSALPTLDVSNWNTSNVTDMNLMFEGCSALTTLDVSNWNTSNVTAMANMFCGCSSLTALAVSDWNTSNVTYMTTNTNKECGMFNGCSSLRELDLSRWDVSHVEVMISMFKGCSSLQSLNVSNWEFGNNLAVSKNSMFEGCSSLTELDLSSWKNVNKFVVNGRNMFKDCSSLQSLNVSNWDVSNIGIAENMFSGCSSLTTLDLSSWNTPKVRTLIGMFSGCSSLQSLDLSGFNTSKVTGTTLGSTLRAMKDMFTGCTALSEVKLGEDFRFNGNGFEDVTLMALLPTPPADTTTGKWIRGDEPDTAMTAEELRDAYDATLAGTWVWQAPGYGVRFDGGDAAGSMRNLYVTDLEHDLTLTNGYWRFNHTFTGYEVTESNAASAPVGTVYPVAGDGKTVVIPALGINEAVTLKPVFEPNDNTAHLVDGVFYITLHGGEKATVPNLPAGTTYQIYEETPDGWVLVNESGTSGVIRPNETAEAWFLNRYQPETTAVQFYGSKTLDGRAAEADAFTFELLDGDGRVIAAAKTLEGGMFRFPRIEFAGAEAVGSYTYTIREVTGTDAAIRYDGHTETVTVEVTADEWGGLHAAVTYDDDGVRFANTTRPGELRVTKEATGLNDANRDTEFELEIQLSNENGPLGAGESVYYYLLNEDGSIELPAAPADPGSEPDGPDANVEPSVRPERRPLLDTLSDLLTGAGQWLLPTAEAEDTHVCAILTDDYDVDGDGTADAGTLLFYNGSNTTTGPGSAVIDGHTCTGTVFAPLEGGSHPWTGATYKDTVKKVIFTEDVTVKSAASMFSGCSNLTTVEKLYNLRLDNGTGGVSADQMFRVCGSLTAVETVNPADSSEYFDTSNVTTMREMFRVCSDLTALDVSNWNTSNVTDMGYMFSGCSGLTTLDVSGFDTSKVTNMYRMFMNCSGLTTLDVSDWDTSKVTSMGDMFDNCSGLTTLDVSDWDTSKVTRMEDMFSGCSGLTALDVSGWDTSNVTNMGSMFSGCSGLTELDVSGFNTSKVTNMSNMFLSCSGLTTLDVSGFNTSKVTTMLYMFYNCSKLTTLDVSRWNTSNVTDMRYMFYNCSGLTALDVSNFNTSKVTNMSYMFYNCSDLTTLDVSGFDTSKVTYMFFMFSGCSGLTTLDVSGFNTSNVTRMENMFDRCSGLTTLDVSGFNTSNVTRMWAMFSGCSGLTTLDVSGFNTSKVTHMYGMFSGCSGLTSLDLSGFDTSKVAVAKVSRVFHSMDDMFADCTALSEVKLGESFRFNGNGFEDVTYMALLPTPPAATTGRWRLVDSKPYIALTASDLRDVYDATLAGTWVWEYPSAIFDGNGGVTYAPAVQLPARVTMPDGTTTYRLGGYRLTGWNTAPDGSGTAYEPGQTVDLASSGSANTVLYAQWDGDPTQGQYLIKAFWQNPDNTSYPAAPTRTELVRAAVGTEVTVTAPEYEGVHLDPARDHSDVTFTVSADEAREICYYYVRDRYTVTFDGNGGAGHMEPQAMVGGISANLTENAYSKSGSLFIGWNTQPDGTGVSYADGQSVLNLAGNGATVTLYAQWLSNDAAVTPAAGAITVRVKAGQTVVIPNLPAGTTYTVREINVPDGWTQTGIENGSGVISANETSRATVTNAYAAEGTAIIEAHKAMVGRALESGAYTFRLLDETGAEVATATNGAPDENEELEAGVTNPWYGTGAVRFEVSYTRPGTYTYQIAEVAGEDDTVIYDGHTETVTVEVTDNGRGRLNTTVSYDADGALFTNAMQPGELEVSKTVVNATAASEGTEFTFTLGLQDADGRSLSGEYAVTVYAGETGESAGTVSDGGTVSIHGGERFVVSGLPHGAAYTVSEAAADGWTMTGAVNDRGTIRSNDTVHASFENTYNATGSVTLEAEKVFVGGELGLEMFQFQVADSAGTVLRTAYAHPDGTAADRGHVTFAPIDYTLADVGEVFTYTVSEVPGELEQVVYDEHLSQVRVTVTDDGHGHLTPQVEYLTAEDAEGIVFTNVTLHSLTVSKTVEGNLGDRTRRFGFELRLQDAEGQPYTGEISAPEGVEWMAAATAGVYTFSLKHAESLTLELPYGVSYRVTETAVDGYETTVAVDGGASAAGTEAAGVMTEDHAVAYVNTLQGVPSGLGSVSAWLYAAAAGILTAGACLTLRPKRKED